MTSHNSLNSLLSGSDSVDLRHLSAHAKKLKNLTAKIRTVLDSASSEHCTVANLRDQTLILQTSSPAWVAKLRFQIPMLINALKSSSTPVTNIQIKVVPENKIETTHENISKPQYISPSTAELLEGVANHISNSDLKSSLLRLSKRVASDKE
ncbi:MAG: DUF721 domain-containing protein [Gammaproteobacteria bacterium]|nr:DUF721 domain-containing protein [Gammaproteobacteria bacterium]MDH5593960.1 DUF721 domain-containing protein [Gammaproteobacteria bacterium]